MESVLYDACEEDQGVSTWWSRCWRQMDVLDHVSFAQWHQTFRRIATAHSPSKPTDAHAAIERVRTDGNASPTGISAGFPKGGIHLNGTGREVRADVSSALCLGEMDQRADWCGV